MDSRTTILAALLLLAGSLLLLAGCGEKPPPLSLSAAADSVRVIDGDTIQLRAHRIRLWGIDAPELRHTGGSEARLALVTLLGLYDATIKCVRRTPPDRWGRMIATCYVSSPARHGPLDIAAFLVGAGYARDWPEFSGGYYSTNRRTE